MRIKSSFFIRFTAGTVILIAANLLTAAERSIEEIADIYRVAASLAAGSEHGYLQSRVCPASPRALPQATPSASAAASNTPLPRTIPLLANWYHEQVKVFDELYFVGTQEHSSWAVVSSEGIMLLDTLYDYATGDAIISGLQKLGFDPVAIQQVIIGHGHGDHHAGARYLQDEFGARVVMGAADWDPVARDQRNPIPRRDIEAGDGMSFTLGNTTITLYHTPGHTYGTLSSIITLTDNGRAHTVAYWGGTSITTVTPTDRVQLYIDSAVRFRNIARIAGADVLLSNHLAFDGIQENLPLLVNRSAGAAHPYVKGFDFIARYLMVAENCARAEMAFR